MPLLHLLLASRGEQIVTVRQCVVSVSVRVYVCLYERGEGGSVEE